jgi:SAM-dependent methyltransferase
MAQPNRSLPPIIAALLAQLMAFGLTTIGTISDIGMQGLLAALFGLALRLPWWWLPLNLLFPVAVTYILSLALPPWLFFFAFSLLLLLNWNSARERVPLYLSNHLTWEGIDELLPKKEKLRFIDLGSGLGGTLFYLARQHPDYHFSGIESSPLSFAIGWLRLHLSGSKNIELQFGDFWKENLEQYDVVYAFLSPTPMPRLYNKLRQEMRTGTLLISNSFTVPENDADSIVELPDRRHTQLYCWHFGEHE